MKPRERIKNRKNFFPTLLLATILWVAWGWLIYSTAPSSNLKLFIFFLLLFLAVFLTFALIFANSRRGLLSSLIVVTLLIFRYYQLANLLNLFLLFAIVITIELYYCKR
jgi:hypothetical protein